MKKFLNKEAINRTKPELKHFKQAKDSFSFDTINRTKPELKLFLI